MKLVECQVMSDLDVGKDTSTKGDKKQIVLTSVSNDNFRIYLKWFGNIEFRSSDVPGKA